MSQDVWLVDDDHAIRWVLERALQQAQISSRSFEDGQQLLAALKQIRPNSLSVIFVCLVLMAKFITAITTSNRSCASHYYDCTF